MLARADKPMPWNTEQLGILRQWNQYVYSQAVNLFRLTSSGFGVRR